jgi:TetR/AcrR family transcriptional repressor of mexJK operon
MACASGPKPLEALMDRTTDQWVSEHRLGPNADRRQEILQVAFKVFADKGYSGATMLEIAQRARASKETLYAWFQNKEKLFETLLLSLVSEITARLPKTTFDAPEPEIRLPAIAEAMLRVTTTPDWIAMMRIAIGEASRFPELRRIMANLFMSRDGLIAYLNNCRCRGLMEFEDAAEMAGLFISMVDGDWPSRLLFGMIDEVSEERIVAHAALVSRLFLKAVAPRSTSRKRRLRCGSPARRRDETRRMQG